MNEKIQIIFGLLGGLAVFIYGMNMMSECLQKAAGDKMKSILALLTKNPLLGVLAGALTTAVLQSSSATTVMAIGFVSAGLMNLPQAILGAGVGCYRDSVHMKAISDKLKEELEAIALAKGIDMSKVENTSTQRSAVPPSARYSTLQDLDAGRQTEIEMFSGALIRMGKELGIPTPYNEYTYHMIKALEEKNEGVFDYRGGKEEPVMFK